MVKHIMSVLLGIFLCNSIYAIDKLQNPLNYVGKSIEHLELPLIGKLTNILPVALAATAFKDCPGQTMLALTGLLIYCLYRNESVRELFKKYTIKGLARFGIQQNSDDEDETLFIFDGEDAEDAEEEMEIEDELLSNASESDDAFRKKEDIKQQPVMKFL